MAATLRITHQKDSYMSVYRCSDRLRLPMNVYRGMHRGDTRQALAVVRFLGNSQ